MRLAVSVGCPSGIGPEVAVVAANELCGRAGILLVGEPQAVLRAAEARGVARHIEIARVPTFVRRRIHVWQPGPPLRPSEMRLGRPSAAGGRAQLAWIDAACDAVVRGEADVLVTGPVSKDVIASSGAPGAARFRGHTEHLRERLGAREVVMAFAGPKLTTALVTTHLPLREVPRAITPEAVATACFWLGDFLRRGARKPRLAVAALNPHAGEHGLLGDEEARIAAGMRRARARLRGRAELVGPLGAETAFRLAVQGQFDGVVGMYHDQVTIPMKLLDFGDAVNVSLGLPIRRTSVDHGTAYDRAPFFDASAQGMVAAMSLGIELSN